MDYLRPSEIELRISHRHDDQWFPLRRVHHDPADHDPERAWDRGRIYRCDSCEEEIRIEPGSDEG